MKKILVTGATGILGSAVIETLLKKISSQQINVLVRQGEQQTEFQSKGFDAYQGNYDDPNSLEKAMKGVDTVLLISGGNKGDLLQQHHNVVDAAKKTGVKGFAYTSRALRDRATLSNQLMVRHFDTEDYIKDSGLKYVIFRNALYMDVIPLFVGKQVFETGIFQPAGEGKVAFALRKEMGEAMANVLLNEDCEKQVYKLTGSQAYSFYDVASVLTELGSREVKYTPIDAPTFKARMAGKIPDPMLAKIIDFNTDIKNGQESEVTKDLENKLERKPTSLKKGLKVLFGL